jgi:hypothetical protein
VGAQWSEPESEHRLARAVPVRPTRPSPTRPYIQHDHARGGRKVLYTVAGTVGTPTPTDKRQNQTNNATTLSWEHTTDCGTERTYVTEEEKSDMHGDGKTDYFHRLYASSAAGLAIPPHARTHARTELGHALSLAHAPHHTTHSCVHVRQGGT